MTPLLASVIPGKSITHLFGAHTAAGKNIFPRLAGALDVSMVGSKTKTTESRSDFGSRRLGGKAC